MDQSINIDLGSVRTRGRATAPLSATYIRDLGPGDLDLLKVEKGVKPPALQRLRDTHHLLARYLALGSPPAEASAVTGYSPSRISILLGDPAFQELLSFYRDQRNEGYFSAKAQIEERLFANMLTAEARISEKLEENDEISEAMLNKIAMDRADRLGYGPTSKSTNVNVLVSADALAATRKRLEKFQARAPESNPEPGGVTTIDATIASHEENASALAQPLVPGITPTSPGGTAPEPAPSDPAGPRPLSQVRTGVSDDDRR